MKKIDLLNKNSEEYTNLIKINLQQTKYAHIATFPEKLVETLIKMLNLPKNARILDPFCGSGTLIQAVQTVNEINKRNM